MLPLSAWGRAGLHSMVSRDPHHDPRLAVAASSVDADPYGPENTVNRIASAAPSRAPPIWKKARVATVEQGEGRYLRYLICFSHFSDSVTVVPVPVSRTTCEGAFFGAGPVD